jgi:hypothetical protein
MTLFRCLAFVIASAMMAAPAMAETITFQALPAGPPPVQFTFARTGNGAPGDWAVVNDGSAEGMRALAQLSQEQLSQDKTDYRFPLAIYTPAVLGDVAVSIRFRAVSGSTDRGAGIAIRLRDPDNYYVVRSNALEDNVYFYRVLNGQREELRSATVKVAAINWHMLSLRAEGDRFQIAFDGKPLIDLRDKTFNAPGRIALWIKADSVTHFDRIEITPLTNGGKP